jgi:hypothetical protein
MSPTLRSFIATLIKDQCRPSGAQLHFFTFPRVPLRFTLGYFWSRLRRLVHRSATHLLNPKVSDIGL